MKNIKNLNETYQVCITGKEFLSAFRFKQIVNGLEFSSSVSENSIRGSDFEPVINCSNFVLLSLSNDSIACQNHLI